MIDKTPPSLAIKTPQAAQNDASISTPPASDKESADLLPFSEKQFGARNHVRISAAGHLISSLLNTSTLQPFDTNDRLHRLTVLGNQALLLNEETNLGRASMAEHLKTRLNTAISVSGVFYESHLRQWMLGEREISEISKEPQVLLFHRGLSKLGTDVEPHNSELRQIVSQQFAVLESQEIKWLGDLSDGIPMQWHIARNNDQARENIKQDKSDQSNWFSELKIDLPLLGMVTITVKLCDQQVNLAVTGNRHSSIKLIKSNFEQLNDALTTTGVTISSFCAQYHEKN